MKKLYIFALFASSLTVNYAQTGIHTTTPQGVFHVDPMKNTIGQINISDDFVITSDGNVGIGTATPQAKLHIVGSLKINDGSQGAGKFLSSDQNGNLAWIEDSGVKLKISSDNFDSALAASPVTNTPKYNGVNITLPPGKWQINLRTQFRNDTNTTNSINMFLCTSSTELCASNGLNTATSSSGYGANQSILPILANFTVDIQTTTTYYIWMQAAANITTGAINFFSNHSIAGVSGISNVQLWAVPTS